MNDDINQIMAEINAEATGAPAPTPVKEPEPEVVEDDTIVDEDGEDAGVDDGDTADVAGDDDVDDADTGDVEEEDKRSKVIPRDRFDKVNEKYKLEKDRSDALEAQVQEMGKKYDDMAALLKESLSPKKEEEPETEWLDPDAQKKFEEMEAKFEEREGKLEQRLEAKEFVRSYENLEAQARKTDTNYDEKVAHLIAVDMSDLIEQGMGNAEAKKQAMQNHIIKSHKIFASGKDPVAYAIGRAELMFPHLRSKAKPANGKKKASLNIDELETLKNEGGAPTNKTASSDAAGGSELDNMLSSIAKEKAETQTY